MVCVTQSRHRRQALHAAAPFTTVASRMVFLRALAGQTLSHTRSKETSWAASTGLVM
jgi:hypothetical protein